MLTSRLQYWDSSQAPVYIDTYSVKAAKHLKLVFQKLRQTIYVTSAASMLSTNWSRFPGLLSTDADFALKYCAFLDALNQEHLQNLESQTRAFPRGCIDSSIVICGIAPGWTADAYHESFWLLGPASKTLQLGVQDHSVYYTNICKTSFLHNEYSEAAAQRWIKLFNAEMELLQPSQIIFLGKYALYSQVQLPKTTQRSQVYHPSYVNYRHLHRTWSAEVQQLLSSASQYSQSVLPVHYTQLAENCHLHNSWSYL